MSNVTVEFDQSFPVGKTVIKTTPMMSLKSIVVMACEKFSLTDPENYGLKHGRSKDLDLSLSMRFANLPAGAKLSLYKKSVVGSTRQVTVALQTEEFGRLVQTFPSGTSFWNVFEYFESANNINITKRSGIPNENNGVWKAFANLGKSQVYLMPIAVFMNREYATLDDLMKTTLEDAGLSSGNGVIRLLFKYDPTTLKDMVKKIEDAKLKNVTQSLPSSVPTKEIIEKPISDKKEANSVQENNDKDEAKQEIKKTVQNAEQIVPVSKVDNNINSLSHLDRQITVFQPIPDDYAMPKFDLPDSFFELSTNELKFLLSNMDSKKAQEDNAGFKTKLIREREQAMKAQKYPKTCIRIRFPDKHVLQLTFFSQEKVSELYAMVSQSLQNSETNFNLFVTPPMTILDPQKTFWGSSLSPASVVYINSNNGTDLKLKPSLLENAEPFPILESKIPDDSIPDEDIPQSGDFRVSKSVEIGADSKPDANVDGESKKTRQLPKWLKLNK